MTSAEPIPFPPRPGPRPAGGGVVSLGPGAPRIRRADDPPDDLHLELQHAFHRAYPRSLHVGAAGEGLWLRYRAGPKAWLTEDELVATREVAGWLCDGPARIGALVFR